MKKWWKKLGIALSVVVSAYALVAIGYNLALADNSKAGKTPNQPPTVVKELEVSDIDPAILLSETNKHRVENGVAPLILNQKLNLSALTKCSDMVARDYWSHNTPDGQEPWIFITAAGYSYATAGENLGYGYPNASSVVNGWKASPEHNANLLNTRFTEVGFGICKSEKYTGAPGTDNGSPQVIIVQQFTRPYAK